MLVYAEKMSRCQQLKTVWKEVQLAISKDKISWLTFYGKFVN